MRDRLTAAAEEPLTAEQAARFSGLSAREAADGLLDVGQFLEPTARIEGRYQLYHQWLVDFLGSREQAGAFWIDLAAEHGRLSDAYLGEVAPEWSEADGYGLRHLPRHLQAAGRVEALQKLLLDYGWLRAKLARAGVRSLLADFELLEKRDESLQILYEALRLSAHVLERDAGQLASQLWGRLGERPEEALSALLAQAAEVQEGVWLRPLAGHVGRITDVGVTPDGGRTVSAAGDGTVKVWELASWAQVATFTGESAIFSFAVAPDGRTIVAREQSGRVHFLWLEGVDGGGALANVRGCRMNGYR